MDSTRQSAGRELEVTVEHVAVPDSEERIRRAFELILWTEARHEMVSDDSDAHHVQQPEGSAQG